MSPADSLAAQLVRDCGAEYRQAPGAAAADAGGAAGASGGAASPAGGSAADGAGEAGEIAASAVPAKGAGGKEQASAAAAPQSPPAKGAAPSGSGSGAALGSGLSAYVDSLGRPVDLIFECTGYSPLAFEAMGALGPNGVLALLGVTPADRKLEIPSDALNQEIVLENKCVLGSVNASRKDFETGLYRLGEMQRRYPELLAGLITNRLKLEDVPQLDFAQIPIKAVVDVVPQAQWADMVKPSTEPAYSFSV
ncbi:hypothetical protein B5M42_009135 [Paenibacillus athensensis]|nr:hypothetical protein [Paenibacillus athensensis]